MAKIFYPNPERMTQLDYAGVADIPVIFDSSGRYCRAHNRYLRERASLDWHPNGGSDFPRPRTLRNIAEQLLNFILWCELRSKDYTTVTYANVLCYQNEQISGEWSLQGRELERSTANKRADEAKHFLCWAANRGLRGPFEVKEFFRSGPDTFGTPRAVRAGRAKENLTPKSVRSFVLPTQEEVNDWLKAVRRQRGYAKYLACRCITEVGLRRKEVEALEIHQWPTSNAIDKARRRGFDSVPMDLVETKGGRPRTVKVPIPYAQRVRKWIDESRETYARRYSKPHGNSPDRTRLFVSDHPAADGNPISAQTIYRCFVEIEPRPEGWSPHKGRHTFACFWVLRELELEASQHGGLAAMGADWIMHQGAFFLKKLQRQFGHMAERTTEVYLQCLATSCGVAELASDYHLDLDGGSDECDR